MSQIGRETMTIDGGRVQACVLRWHRGHGWGDCDEGSGTVAGAMLVLVVALLMGAVAAGGAVVIAGAKARGVADTAAVSAAQALLDGHADPCGVARTVVALHDAELESCDMEGEDVEVSIRLPTGVPVAAWVVKRSRAGPVLCDIS